MRRCRIPSGSRYLMFQRMIYSSKKSFSEGKHETSVTSRRNFAAPAVFPRQNALNATYPRAELTVDHGSWILNEQISRKYPVTLRQKLTCRRITDYREKKTLRRPSLLRNNCPARRELSKIVRRTTAYHRAQFRRRRRATDLSSDNADRFPIARI